MGYLNCLKLINKAAGRKLSDAEHTALQERFNDAVKQLEPTVKDKAALYKQAAELAASKLKQDAMDYQATAHKYLAGHEMVKSGSLLQTANPFDRGVQPSSYKNEVNSSSADSKFLSNLLESRTFLTHGISGFDVPSQRVVMDRVISLLKDRKIFNAVIKSVPIDVVDLLRSRKLTSDMLLHDKSMLFKLDVPVGDDTVAMSVDAPSAIVAATAREAAKQILVSPEMVRLFVNDNPAMATSRDHFILRGGDITSSIYHQPTLDKIALLERNGEKLDSPHETFPFVYKNYIAMKNPLVTNDIPQYVMDVLATAAKRDRSRAQRGGADMWDKNTRTLKEWYQALTDPENTTSAYVWTSIPDKVTQVFKDLGFDGIIDESGKGGGNKHTVYIPFEENQVKSAIGNKGTFGDTSNILKQGAKGSYSPSRNLIQLYKTADVTTVVHESAHQYFDTYAKIALDPNAPATIKADTDTILHFLGVDSLSDWHTMSLEEQRPYHEKLATTFERYMMEDKAPSALMNVFAKIKTWMLETYKSLTDVGVEPTPELRAVFDKWSGQDIIPDRFKMGDFTPVETPRVASEVIDDPYVSEANRIVEEMPDMKIPLADINGNPLMDENGEPRMVSAKDYLDELHADRVASETNDAKFVTAALQCILGAA